MEEFEKHLQYIRKTGNEYDAQRTSSFLNVDSVNEPENKIKILFFLYWAPQINNSLRTSASQTFATVGAPVILLHTLNSQKCLCNGACLIRESDAFWFNHIQPNWQIFLHNWQGCLIWLRALSHDEKILCFICKAYRNSKKIRWNMAGLTK